MNPAVFTRCKGSWVWVGIKARYLVKLIFNSTFFWEKDTHSGQFFGVRVIRGMSISSSEIPPCWKVPL